jgi:mannose/cellobiose epimerase-like protein (N-acyl-D-glucosamine 2-epimerase family)
MLEVFATLASLFLVVQGVGRAFNAPNRALASLNGVMDARTEQAYQRAALLLSQAQAQLVGAPDTTEARKLNFQLQRAYDLAMARNPGAFEMMHNIFRNVQQGWGPLCPNCGQEYGERRTYFQHCLFHRKPIQIGDQVIW